MAMSWECPVNASALYKQCLRACVPIEKGRIADVHVLIVNTASCTPVRMGGMLAQMMQQSSTGPLAQPVTVLVAKAGGAFAQHAARGSASTQVLNAGC